MNEYEAIQNKKAKISASIESVRSQIANISKQTSELINKTEA